MGLFEQLDEEVTNAEAWVAEVGDKIVGRVIKVDTREGGYGEYPIATIEVQEGTVGGKPIEVPATRSLHLMATVLRGEVGWILPPGKGPRTGHWGEERTLFVGCEIGLKYEGKRQGRDNEYDAWRCIVEPPPTTSAKLDNPDLFSKG